MDTINARVNNTRTNIYLNVGDTGYEALHLFLYDGKEEFKVRSEFSIIGTLYFSDEIGMGFNFKKGEEDNEIKTPVVNNMTKEAGSYKMVIKIKDPYSSIEKVYDNIMFNVK